MLWVESEASVLNKRLDDRVDKMVESGMLDEMLQFHDKFNKDRIEKKGKTQIWGRLAVGQQPCVDNFMHKRYSDG